MEGYARVSFKWVVSIAIVVSLRQQTDENIPSSECTAVSPVPESYSKRRSYLKRWSTIFRAVLDSNVACI